MNGIVERGELYWVRMGDSVGSEEAVGRPGVIISSQKGNETSNVVQIAYTTTQVKYGIINPSTYASGKKTWILCNQIQTVDKIRLGRYIGKLTDQEMRTVDDALEAVFDLGYADDDRLKEKDSEIESLKTEVAGIKAAVGKKDDEITSLKMEIEMWQKCYGRCMDMLVDMKVSGDMSRRTAAPVAPVKIVDPEEPVLNNPPKNPDPPKNPVEPDNRLDINNCTATALKKIGFSLAIARKIVESRPFNSVEDLKRVNGLKITQYRIMEPKLCCNPMVAAKKPPKVEFVKDEPDPGYEVEEPVVVETPAAVETPVVPEPPKVLGQAVVAGKVNVNTVATAKELTEKTGMCTRTTNGIITYRKEHGNFSCLEDLLKTPAFGAIAMKRYGHMLEV
jgi:competence ComEA-like helix-hairpin-helix protein